jgi:sugar phosphate permease
LGAAITPVLVVWIMTTWGWRYAFISFGALGILWAIVWFIYYRDTPDEHSGVNKAELALIHHSLGGPKTRTTRHVPWRMILASPTLLMVSSMYFLYGYCIQVYLIWFPTYLKEHRGMTLKEMGFYASLPLLAGTLGDLLGGIASDFLAHRTGNLKLARRGVAMFGFLMAAAGYPHHRSASVGGLYMPWGVRAGVDGRGILGDSAGHWRGLRGLRLSGYEHVR